MGGNRVKDKCELRCTQVDAAVSVSQTSLAFPSLGYGRYNKKRCNSSLRSADVRLEYLVLSTFLAVAPCLAAITMVV